jgi:23S rRNA pseudouridine2605 synthase
MSFDEAQLAAARAKAWHQDGNAVLTLEAARDWVNSCGLVLFAARSAQLPVPAPSLVEATLGVANAAPTMDETQVARSLVSRLVGEGLALPLNLLGVPGDSPDFVVSAQVFSYIFTMRGDKAWKQPPSTAGAVRVSPLGLRVYEVLTERGPMSAAELALELGREVTEAAILRSLSELWSQLRVLPLLQMGDGVTLWELTSRRFTKAIKAGANAGLPKALSAVVSLYLAQVFAATEEEVTTFVSPLTARSRVREVLHALIGARQLDTVVVEGKTLLHIPGGLPVSEGVAVEPGTEVGDVPAAIERPKKVGTGRISKFSESPERKPAGEFRGKPSGRGVGARAARPAFGAKPAGKFGAKPGGKFGSKPAAKYGARLDGKSDPERRPFKKDGGTKPSFSKPWDEDKKPRPVRAVAPDGFTKFRKPGPEDRAPLGPREQAGLPVEMRSAPRSTRSFDRAAPKPGGFAKRPYTPRGEGEERPTFRPRSYERPGSARPDGDSKPRSFAAKAGGFAAKRPYTPRTSEGDGEKSFTKRPYTPRATEGGERPYQKKPYAPRASAGGGESSFAKRPYTPRATEGGERPFKKPYAPRTNDDGARPKPSYAAKTPYAARTSEGSFPKRAYTPRSAEGAVKSFAKRPYTPRVVEENGERSLPKRPYKPRAADADQRQFTKAPWTPPAEETGGKPKRAFKPRTEGSFLRGGAGPRKSFGSKPAVKFGGAPGSAKPFARKKPKTEE